VFTGRRKIGFIEGNRLILTGSNWTTRLFDRTQIAAPGITAWLFNKLVPKVHQTDQGSLAKCSARGDNAAARVKLGVRGM